MADQQPPPSPTDPSSLTLRDAKSSSSNSSYHEEDPMDTVEEEFKKRTKLQELQRKAFCSVIYAFKAENFTISFRSTHIIRKLMSEWNISQETYDYVADKIEIYLKNHPLIHTDQQDCSEDMQIVEKRPLINRINIRAAALQQQIDTMKAQLGMTQAQVVHPRPSNIGSTSSKEATLSQTCVVETDPSWGRVDPYSLIGKTVNVKLPLEERFQEFVIKLYDIEQDMHSLEYTDPNSKWTDDYYSWIDLRQLTPNQEIMWKHGEEPDFET